jgi:hypothetical protein
MAMPFTNLSTPIATDGVRQAHGMLPVERIQLSLEQSECLVGQQAESESLLGLSAKHKNKNSVYLLQRLCLGVAADMEEQESEEVPDIEDPPEAEEVMLMKRTANNQQRRRR